MELHDMLKVFEVGIKFPTGMFKKGRLFSSVKKNTALVVPQCHIVSAPHV